MREPLETLGKRQNNNDMENRAQRVIFKLVDMECVQALIFQHSFIQFSALLYERMKIVTYVYMYISCLQVSIFHLQG